MTASRPLIRTECGATLCTVVISGLPCGGRMEPRGTLMPSDPGRLYCVVCGADRPIPDPEPRR